MVPDHFDEHCNPAPRDADELLSANEGFSGSAEHLERFAAVAATPLRHPSRSEALHAWKDFNRVDTLDDQGLAIKASPRFRGVDLRGADLRNVYLGYVDLRGARLDECDLRGARMKGAKFAGAVLRGARLDDAYFAFADFAHADLGLASCAGTNFREAKLIGADFTRAELSGALLADTQRRDWVLRGTSCAYAYWNPDAPPTAYGPGELERLFSEEHIITLDAGAGVSPRDLSSLPMLVQALKMHSGATIRLQNVEDNNGRSRVRFKVEDAAGLARGALDSLVGQLHAALREKETVIFQNEIHTVGQLIQGENINIVGREGG